MYGKWPRQYAHEITKMHDKADRIAALEKVPEQFKGLVRAHVEDYFSHMRHARQQAEPKPQHWQQPAPSLSNAQRDAGRGHCELLRRIVNDENA